MPNFRKTIRHLAIPLALGIFWTAALTSQPMMASALGYETTQPWFGRPITQLPAEIFDREHKACVTQATTPIAQPESWMVFAASGTISALLAVILHIHRIRLGKWKMRVLIAIPLLGALAHLFWTTSFQANTKIDTLSYCDTVSAFEECRVSEIMHGHKALQLKLTDGRRVLPTGGDWGELAQASQKKCAITIGYGME